MPRTNLHPEDIKAAVRKTGVSLSGLARRHTLHVSTVVMAVHRPQPSGNRAIAKHLNKSLHDLWPEWFDRDGNRISGPKDSRAAMAKASQKATAA